MNRTFLLLVSLISSFFIRAGIVEKTYTFDSLTADTMGAYQVIRFDSCMLSALPGEPLLPWRQVVLMLPPGEAAGSIEITCEEETQVPGSWMLFPQQQVRPISGGQSGEFIKNEKIYNQRSPYPADPHGHLMTQYLDGYAFAICSFTPVKYIPALKKVSYYRKITVRVTTKPDNRSVDAMKLLSSRDNVLNRIRSFAQNPEMTDSYPSRRQAELNYDYLVICPVSFINEFQPLIDMYSGKGITVRVVTTDSISAASSGWDLQEKMRNFIISERTGHDIQYVLLAGNPSLVPCRGFYCYVQSGGGYEDFNIPADLYFSGLDGSYDANGNHVYGEIDDDPDLLPDLSVGRFTVNDTAELRSMIRKTISYLTNPVLGEMNKPLLAGEYLYYPPLTFGGPYMDLLVNNNYAYGYYTHGIPSSSNIISKLYDTLVSPPANHWSWTPAQLLVNINQGRSFIHHLGHANTTYMLRFNKTDITDANFYAVNGVDHNFQILYTQGCDCGAFDATYGCIAAKAVTINNFLAAGIFNSRYGWFNEGTNNGPSEHLQREFVSALYNDTAPERHLGTAHLISKIKTAPYISLPSEFEPGAQRWVHYDCNVFGDPALEIWVAEPASFTTTTWTGTIDSDWLKDGNWSPAKVPTSLNDVLIGITANPPVIGSVKKMVCHDLTIQPGATLIIQEGKSLIVRGALYLQSP